MQTKKYIDCVVPLLQVWCSYGTPEYELQALVTDPHTTAKYR